MTKWYTGVWFGLVLTIVGSIIYDIIKFLFKKYRPKLFGFLFRWFSGLVIKYAENKRFVEICEKNSRYDLILIRYHMTMDNYTRNQIALILSFISTLIGWIVYLYAKSFTIFWPIVFSLYTLKNLYDCLSWYFAISGAFPSEMKKFSDEIRQMKKQDRDKFIMDAISDR